MHTTVYGVFTYMSKPASGYLINDVFFFPVLQLHLRIYNFEKAFFTKQFYEDILFNFVNTFSGVLTTDFGKYLPKSAKI